MAYSSEEPPQVVHVDVAPGEDPDVVAERIGAALDAADPSGKRPVSMSVQVGDGPAVTIVSSAELLEQGGTLDARYWVHRLPGESVAAYRHRMAVQDIERRAVRHEAQAAALRIQAAELRERGVPQ